MFFSSFSEFIAMGTHGTYVWSAYFIVVFSFVTLFLITKRRYKKLQNKIKQIKN